MVWNEIIMSAHKFESLVDKMIHSASGQNYAMAIKIGDLLKMTFSEAIHKSIPEKKFKSRIARNNIGKRVRPLGAKY
jgi:hypothetical protein